MRRTHLKITKYPSSKNTYPSEIKGSVVESLKLIYPIGICT